MATDFASMTSDHNHDMDVLVLAPFGKDAALIGKVLSASGVKVCIVSTIAEIIAAIPEAAGVAIITEEALHDQNIVGLAQKLAAAPPWSDLPIIVLTGGGGSTDATEIAVRSRAPLGNVALLERPLRAATLLSMVRSTLAARRRQYEIRNHLHERKLTEEALRSARDTLESIVEERTAALRHLSAKLLRAQDDECRRIARELHDSLGQYLAAAKINLDIISLHQGEEEKCLLEVQQLIDSAIAETRTLSHLLHPPLLDAAGFASAAAWYVSEFGKRSSIKSRLDMPENLPRLPMIVEITLFRILQEALTNVHRHSGSPAVHIVLEANESTATLTVTDHGKGIPREILDTFAQTGINVGVGLAGIRERVKELDGKLEISSSPAGTTLKARIPVIEPTLRTSERAATPGLYSSLAS
jgi:signal transduction histidine kinase